MSALLSTKHRKWLDNIRAASNGTGMYPGLTQDMVPGKAANVLYRAGYIEPFIPHNFMHKERWQITDLGREALKVSS